MMRMVGLLLVLLTVTARISADPELLLAKLEHNYKRSLRGEVIGALSKAMLYMNSKYYELNLDALTGLRIAEAQFKSMHLAYPEDETIESLQQLAAASVDKALSVVTAYDPEYFKALGRLAAAEFWNDRSNETASLYNPMIFWRELSSLTQLAKNQNNREHMTEDISDLCLGELLDGRCNVSQHCLELMTQKRMSGYTSTHQVYYLIVLRQSGCVVHYEDMQSLSSMCAKMCAKEYYEASEQPKTTSIGEDLFMEQIGLCGLGGYWQEFSQPSWIESVLGWQKESGCYGDAQTFLKELASIDEEKRFRRSTRVKREERIMGEGCLCHRTTVAILALIQHLKALSI